MAGLVHLVNWKGSNMVYKIGWRNQMKNGLISQTIWGLTRYSSREQAEKQITLWSALFPQNTYYCEAQ